MGQARSSLLGRIREAMADDPLLTRALIVWSVVQLVVALWDLPSRFSWENDGMAPRDIFAGLGTNLTPGQGHRYPLFHYVLVAVAALPAWLLALVTAGGFSGSALEQRILQADVMTLVALAAKLLAVGMGFVTIVMLARIVRRTVRSEHALGAARFAAFFAATNVSVAYYGRSSNLDGPAMMWTVLVLDVLLDLRGPKRGDVLSSCVLGCLIAAAVATKDQAYGAFALTVPLYLAYFGKRARVAFVPLAGACALTYGVLSGALMNPSGALARVRMLVGPNSQDWRQYPTGSQGLVQNIVDVALHQAEFFWTWPVVALAWAGVLLVMFGSIASDKRGALLPLAMAASSFLTFTLVVARCEHRFVLPLALALCCYAGIAAQQLQTDARRMLRSWDARAARVLTMAGLAVLRVPCAGRSIALAATQWTDSRHEVERYLADLPRGSRVEVYGLLVYWPSFDFSADAPYRVTHVDRRRMRMPDLAHAPLPYADPRDRDADVLVMPLEFAERYRPKPVQPTPPSLSDASLSDVALASRAPDAARAEATQFFGALFDDRLPGYRRALLAAPAFPAALQRLGLHAEEIHGSTGNQVAVFVRDSGADAPVPPVHANL